MSSTTNQRSSGMLCLEISWTERIRAISRGGSVAAGYRSLYCGQLINSVHAYFTKKSLAQQEMKIETEEKKSH